MADAATRLLDPPTLWEGGPPACWPGGPPADCLNEEFDFVNEDGFLMPPTPAHQFASSDLVERLRSALEAAGVAALVVHENFIYFGPPDAWTPTAIDDTPPLTYPPTRLAPDVYVVLGAIEHEAATYRICPPERPVPCLAVEFVSPRTVKYDREKKWIYYAAAGIENYVLFDSYGGLLPQPLQVFQRKGLGYAPVKAKRVGGERRWLLSSLGLWLAPVRKSGSPQLAVFGPDGRPAQNKDELRFEERELRLAAQAAQREAEEAQREAEAVADAERAKRLAAEAEASRQAAELAAVRAELARLRGET